MTNTNDPIRRIVEISEAEDNKNRNNNIVQETEDLLVVDMAGGIKYDQNKPKWHLLPIEIVEEIVKVLTYGAKKYPEFNWQNVDESRIYDAMMRHISAYRRGEIYDESGHRHLAHAATNIIFLMWHEQRKITDKMKVGNMVESIR